MGFAAELRNQYAEDWDAAVNHPFVDQLLDGSLSDETLRHYLVQDYQFCDAFTPAGPGRGLGAFASFTAGVCPGSGGLRFGREHVLPGFLQ